jgi:hypothetical protein
MHLQTRRCQKEEDHSVTDFYDTAHKVHEVPVSQYDIKLFTC